MSYYSILYCISMPPPPVIPRKDTLSPGHFLFFSLYAVTAAQWVSMHDSDLRHGRKDWIARLPTVRQGGFWLTMYAKEKKRENAMAHACAALTLNAYYGSTFTRLGNKITPLYIMSKNRGNCSVNLKKNIKNFSERPDCRIRQSRNHPYHLV